MYFCLKLISSAAQLFAIQNIKYTPDIAFYFDMHLLLCCVTVLYINFILSIQLCSKNMNIYVRQSNTTLKDVDTHRAKCVG
jgi:hypothetical protein